jgi:hypothetical protein
MKDQTKFYVFAGVFGVGILGLLVGIYFWDFATQTSKPAGDGFVSVPSHPINSRPRLVTRTAPEGRLASVPGRLPVPPKAGIRRDTHTNAVLAQIRNHACKT